MVLIATCSYAEFRISMGVPVRISLGVPKYPLRGFNPGRWVVAATPQWSYIRSDEGTFRRKFLSQVDKHGVAAFEDEFEKIARDNMLPEGIPLVLLCFEKLGKVSCGSEEELRPVEEKTCHRRMFAWWWFDQTGIEVPELGSRPVIRPRAQEAPGLF